MSNTPIIISVAGFDPSGGAGLISDIKTFTSLGIWGMSCVSSYTVQTSEAFIGIQANEIKLFEKSLRSLFDTYKINGLKIGLISDKAQIDVISTCIDEYSPQYTVLDPVIKSSTGFEFWDSKMISYIADKLFPKLGSITPNAKEAIALLSVLDGEINNSTREEMAINLNKKFRINIAVTDGDSITGKCRDVYYDGVKLFNNDSLTVEVDSGFTHGTGCMFSSALISYQILGHDFIESCELASDYTKQAISKVLHFNRRQGGLNHMWRQTTL